MNTFWFGQGVKRFSHFKHFNWTCTFHVALSLAVNEICNLSHSEACYDLFSSVLVNSSQINLNLSDLF